MAATDVRPKITLACEECKHRNYITSKNRRNDPDRLEIKKFCPNCGVHREHRKPARPASVARDGAGSRRSSAGRSRSPSRTWSASRRSGSSPTAIGDDNPLYRDRGGRARRRPPRSGRAADLRHRGDRAGPGRACSSTPRSAWTSPGWCTATSGSSTTGRSSPATSCAAPCTSTRSGCSAGNDVLTLRTEVTDADGDPVTHRLRHAGRRGAPDERRDRRRRTSPSATSCRRCTVRVTRAQLVRYAGASGDFNPIHWNERVAAEVGLPDVIAHGMLTMALAGRHRHRLGGRPGRGPASTGCGSPARSSCRRRRGRRRVEITAVIGAVDAERRYRAGRHHRRSSTGRPCWARPRATVLLG